jgi:hypothetical protein
MWRDDYRIHACSHQDRLEDRRGLGVPIAKQIAPTWEKSDPCQLQAPGDFLYLEPIGCANELHRLDSPLRHLHREEHTADD